MIIVVEQRLNGGSVFVDVSLEACVSDSEGTVLHEISLFESRARVWLLPAWTPKHEHHEFHCLSPYFEPHQWWSTSCRWSASNSWYWVTILLKIRNENPVSST